MTGFFDSTPKQGSVVATSSKESDLHQEISGAAAAFSASAGQAVTASVSLQMTQLLRSILALCSELLVEGRVLMQSNRSTPTLKQ